MQEHHCQQLLLKCSIAEEHVRSCWKRSITALSLAYVVMELIALASFIHCRTTP